MQASNYHPGDRGAAGADGRLPRGDRVPDGLHHRRPSSRQLARAHGVERLRPVSVPRARAGVLTCASSRPSCPGVLIVEPDVHRDGRGFFLETYHAERYRDARHRRAVRPGQPLAIGRRHAARPAPAGPAAAGQAGPRHRGRDLRRRRGRPARVADVRPVGRRDAVGRELPAVLRAARLRPRLLRRQPGRAGRVQVHRPLRPRGRDRHRLERSRAGDLLAGPRAAALGPRQAASEPGRPDRQAPDLARHR